MSWIEFEYPPAPGNPKSYWGRVNIHIQTKIMKNIRPETEHEIQNKCISLLWMKGFCVMRLNSGKIPQTDRYGKKRLIQLLPSGTPDLMAIKGGKCLFLEVKRPGAVPTYLQNQKMAELTSFGALCTVVHSEEELLTYLKDMKKGIL